MFTRPNRDSPSARIWSLRVCGHASSWRDTTMWLIIGDFQPPKSAHALADGLRMHNAVLIRCAAQLELKRSDSVLQNKAEIIDRPEIKVVAGKDGILAFLSGSVDMDSSPEVRDQLLLIVRAADPKIVSIDLSGVTHFDSSGLATLIDALRVARSLKTQLTLWGLQGRLLHLFELTGILSLFNGNIEVSQPGCKAI